MSILRQVNADKITAEEALAELEALNPPGLVRQIKELKERIAELNEYIEHLEAELNRANDAVTEHNGKTGEAVIEAREYIDRKSTRLNSSHVAISYAVFCLK